MAEAVGLAASGIAIGTLAAQIASSVIKLKSFYDQVKDAPEDLRDLIEELEILQDVIADIEHDQEQNPISSLLLDSVSNSKCLQLCRRGASQLRELTNQLNGELEAQKGVRKKWVSGKVIFKKDKINKYKVRLEYAIRLLILSQQSYTRTLVRYQPDIIVAKLSQQRASLGSNRVENSVLLSSPESPLIGRTSPPTEFPMMMKYPPRKNPDHWSISTLFGSIAYTRRHYCKTTGHDACASLDVEEREETIIVIRGPSWLINRVWTIRAIKARSGWTFCPRIYNEIPNDSPVFRLIEDDDDDRALQKLLNQRGASPFDRTSSGITFLHIAAYWGRYRMIKLLIHHGADPDCFSNGGSLPLDYAGQKYVNEEPSSYRTEEVFNSMRFLRQNTESEPSKNFLYDSKETFSFLQPIIDPLHYSKSVEERFEQVVSMAFERSHYSSEALSLALDQNSSVPPASVRLSDDRGVTLLHVAAKGIGDMSRKIRREILQLRLREWRDFVAELIKLGSDLHPIAHNLDTPFTNLLYYYIYYYEEGTVSRVVGLQEVLRIWVDGLEEAGVDLVAYGQMELDLHEQGLVNWTFPTYEKCTRYCLAGLTWGPSPTDWKVEMEELEEEYDIPGAWIEDNVDESNVGDEEGSEDFPDENVDEASESENEQSEEGTEEPEQEGHE